MSRVFLIVIDSFGIGEMPDADKFGDEGSNTLLSCSKSERFKLNNMAELGLFNIEGVNCGEKTGSPKAAFLRLSEKSMGKDTTVGHWELMGEISEKPFPTYPKGFPQDVIKEFERRTGRKTLCNLPYSGTKVLEDYGQESIEKNALIVYTSADSVFQVAAHDSVASIGELYSYCETAREMLQGEHAVGRVIARPFVGECPNFTRTSQRHDYSLQPPHDTVLDILKREGVQIIPVGKIYDIFAGKGLEAPIRTQNNLDGIKKTLEFMDEDFHGLCFTNLVDTDMLYGHRNDVDGYAAALTEFDSFVPEMLRKLREDDLLIITADHGCDPGTPSTDHSREYIPVLIAGRKVKPVDLGTRHGFDLIGALTLDFLGAKGKIGAESFLEEII